MKELENAKSLCIVKIKKIREENDKVSLSDEITFQLQKGMNELNSLFENKLQKFKEIEKGIAKLQPIQQISTLLELYNFSNPELNGNDLPCVTADRKRRSNIKYATKEVENAKTACIRKIKKILEEDDNISLSDEITNEMNSLFENGIQKFKEIEEVIRKTIVKL